jgi:hypothetical protein
MEVVAVEDLAIGVAHLRHSDLETEITEITESGQWNVGTRLVRKDKRTKYKLRSADT